MSNTCFPAVTLAAMFSISLGVSTVSCWGGWKDGGWGGGGQVRGLPSSLSLLLLGSEGKSESSGGAKGKGRCLDPPLILSIFCCMLASLNLWPK